MLTAQPREWRRRRPENAATMFAIRFVQVVPQRERGRVRARRIFMAYQEQREHGKWWIAMVTSMANLFLVEAVIILGGGVAQRIVMWMIGLNQHSARQGSAAGPPGNLGDHLERSFGGAKVRQLQPRVY